ncbi:MAG: hypothetical protein ABF490_11360, partial [Lentilactobacillus hilgardii]|uniref:hypothetical protein n=1 Tax=Lentilactobacillus hilgardii TaxID=1588 RepID=UPI0039EC4EE3
TNSSNLPFSYILRVPFTHRFGKTQSCTTDYKIDRPTKVTLERTNDKATREKFSTKNWTLCNQIYEMYKEDYQKRGIPKPYV